LTLRRVLLGPSCERRADIRWTFVNVHRLALLRS